jgi:hypothetical protein
MWNSEVTVFFDRDAYAGFHHHEHLLTPARSLTRELGVTLPQGFVEVGTLGTWGDDVDGERQTYHEEWWTLGQTL